MQNSLHNMLPLVLKKKRTGGIHIHACMHTHTCTRTHTHTRTSESIHKKLVWIAKIWLAKENVEEMPNKNDANKTNKKKWCELPRGATLSPPVHLSTNTVLFFLLINTLFVSLLSISMWKLISTHLATGPGGLVIRVPCSHCCSLASIPLTENQNPASSHCRLRSPEIKTRGVRLDLWIKTPWKS